MASDLISRKALLDRLEEAYTELKKIYDGLQYEDEKRICGAQLSTFAELTMRVRKAPTVDAEPVRHGEWIDKRSFLYGGCINHWECSVCGYGQNGGSNYCPNCGAKMKTDGGKQDAESND